VISGGRGEEKRGAKRGQCGQRVRDLIGLGLGLGMQLERHTKRDWGIVRVLIK